MLIVKGRMTFLKFIAAAQIIGGAQAAFGFSQAAAQVEAPTFRALAFTAALFCAGLVVAGVLLWRGHPMGVPLSAAGWAIQIPYTLGWAGGVEYQFNVGIALWLAYGSDNVLRVAGDISRGVLTVNWHDDLESWAIGINLFATMAVGAIILERRDAVERDAMGNDEPSVDVAHIVASPSLAALDEHGEELTRQATGAALVHAAYWLRNRTVVALGGGVMIGIPFALYPVVEGNGGRLVGVVGFLVVGVAIAIAPWPRRALRHLLEPELRVRRRVEALRNAQGIVRAEILRRRAADTRMNGPSVAGW